MEFINVKNELPKESCAILIQYTMDGIERRTKGMFYMNGSKPTFSAYGSEINNVIAWKQI